MKIDDLIEEVFASPAGRILAEAQEDDVLIEAKRKMTGRDAEDLARILTRVRAALYSAAGEAEDLNMWLMKFGVKPKVDVMKLADKAVGGVESVAKQFQKEPAVRDMFDDLVGMIIRDSGGN